MENTTTTQQKDQILDQIINELIEFMLQAASDIIQCEQEEKYEQCQFIQSALLLQIQNKSEYFALMTGKNVQDVFDHLKSQYDIIYSAVKENS
jgi:hypothetical protein